MVYARLMGWRRKEHGKSIRIVILVLQIMVILCALTNVLRVASANELLTENEIESLLTAPAKRVNFSCAERYTGERQIVVKTVLQSFLDSYEDRLTLKDMLSDVTTDQVCIALYDINNDGKQDIIYSTGKSSWCSQRGRNPLCPFGVLVGQGKNGWRLMLAGYGGTDNVSIVRTSHHGFRDVRLDDQFGISIYRFNGDKYSLFVNRETEHGKKKHLGFVSTTLCATRALRCRFVDKR